MDGTAFNWQLSCRHGEEGVIAEQGLNETYQTIGILPDNPKIREALKEWHGEILLYMTADDE